jgi:hypothetical protein
LAAASSHPGQASLLSAKEKAREKEKAKEKEKEKEKEKAKAKAKAKEKAKEKERERPARVISGRCRRRAVVGSSIPRPCWPSGWATGHGPPAATPTTSTSSTP